MDTGGLLDAGSVIPDVIRDRHDRIQNPASPVTVVAGLRTISFHFDLSRYEALNRTLRKKQPKKQVLHYYFMSTLLDTEGNDLDQRVAVILDRRMNKG